MGPESVRIGLSVCVETRTHTVPLSEKLLSEEEIQQREESFTEEVGRNL